MAKLQKITNKNLIICEGLHDSEFFSHLISTRSLQTFQIASLNFVLGGAHGGNSLFDLALDALVALPGFAILENVILVADNDMNPVLEFQNVVDLINKTATILGSPSRRYIAPPSPKVKSKSLPTLTILMLPDTGVLGSFDALCVSVAANQSPIVSICIDAFVKCVGNATWPLNKLNKLKLRLFVAAQWIKNPGLSVAYVWSAQTNLVPLNDSAFDDIANFLRSF